MKVRLESTFYFYRSTSDTISLRTPLNSSETEPGVESGALIVCLSEEGWEAVGMGIGVEFLEHEVAV